MVCVLTDQQIANITTVLVAENEPIYWKYYIDLIALPNDVLW